MFRLISLGGLLLQQDGSLHLGPAAQRRRLALLAIIAAARGRGVSRERLVALLWPEATPEAGKHSLYQAVPAIRKALGTDEVLLGSTALQLNPDIITADVGEFETAIEQGAYERAVRLWQRLGFAVVGRLPGAFRHRRLGYVDALVMYKQLDMDPPGSRQ